MGRIQDKPGLVMAAYLVLYAAAATQQNPGSVARLQSAALAADAVGVAIAAFLAWRVTRGSAAARALIIVWTIGLIQKVLWGAGMKSGGLLAIGVLALYLAQIALLVSTPIYQRVSGGWAGRRPGPARLWPTPPRWMAGAALAGGLFITLLFLASMDWQSVPCGPSLSTSSPRCVTLAEGFPVHFLSAIPEEANVAQPAINARAAAEDVTIWAVLSFGAAYVLWLPSHRPSRTTALRTAAPA